MRMRAHPLSKKTRLDAIAHLPDLANPRRSYHDVWMTTADDLPGDASPEAVLRAFFDAGQAGDADAAKSCVSADFQLFENGREEGIEHMEAAIQTLRRTGVSIAWTLSDIRIRISGDMASLIYRNHAIIQAPGAAEPQHRHWLENAILIREGRWRISFLQSTPVAEA